MQYTIERLEYGSTKIPQLASAQLSANLQQIMIASAIDNTHQAVGSAKPEINFTTTMIKTILGITGTTSAAISAGNSLVMYMSKLTGAAARTLSVKATATAGLLIPVSLSASKGQMATINCLAILVSDDGTTSPVSLAAASAVTPLETWTKDAYALSSVVIDGTAVADADNLVINFGIGIDDIMGDVYRIAASILSRSPSITLSASDLEVAADLGVAGGVATANTVITLSPMADAAPRAGTDIVLTVAASTMRFGQLGGSAGARAGSDLTITPLNDGTNEPISITGIA